MRDKAQIEAAITHLRDAQIEAARAGDGLAVSASLMAIKALEWVLGSNEPLGFGEMLAVLEAIDLTRAHGVN